MSDTFRRLSIIGLGAIVLAACEELPIRRPEPGQPGCEPACLNLARLDCPEAKVTKAGTSCVALCEMVVSRGLSEIDTACISGSSNRPEVQTCAGIRCR